MAAEPRAYTLDSFALLAYFEDETSGTRIRELLRDARRGRCLLFLCVINLGEVLYITERERGLFQAQRVVAAVDQLALRIIPAARATVLAAAHIKASYPIAYADAFAVACARQTGSVLLTGDPEFHKIEKAGLIAIEWLQR